MKNISFEDREEMERQSSMLYWWPKILHLDIPQPRTTCIRVKNSNMKVAVNGGPLPDLTPVKDAAGVMGYPLFLRSDHMSAKHEWNRTCYVARAGISCPADIQRCRNDVSILNDG